MADEARVAPSAASILSLGFGPWAVFVASSLIHLHAPRGLELCLLHASHFQPPDSALAARCPGPPRLRAVGFRLTPPASRVATAGGHPSGLAGGRLLWGQGPVLSSVSPPEAWHCSWAACGWNGFPGRCITLEIQVSLEPVGIPSIRVPLLSFCCGFAHACF